MRRLSVVAGLLARVTVPAIAVPVVRSRDDRGHESRQIPPTQPAGDPRSRAD